MKRLIVLIAALLLAGWAIWAWQNSSQAPVPGGGEIATYKDPEGVFRFQYPGGWSVSGRDRTEMARVGVPNGDELVLLWSNEEELIRNCTDTNTITTIIRREILDGDCWSFQYPINSAHRDEFEEIIESFQYLVNSD